MTESYSHVNALMEGVKVIAFRPELNTITGGSIATLVLCQLIYWCKIMDSNTYYKNLYTANAKAKEAGQTSLMDELNETKYKIRTAVNQLIDKELIEINHDTLTHNTYIKVNFKILDEMLKFLYSDSNTGNPPEVDKINLRGSEKSTPGSLESQLPLSTEITTDITQKLRLSKKDNENVCDQKKDPFSNNKKIKEFLEKEKYKLKSKKMEL